MKSKKIGKIKTKSRIKTLRKKCWALWSLKRRLEESDEQGYCVCISCGKKYHYKEMHCGHFRHNVLDFDFINTNPQCIHCNRYLSGNLALYARSLTIKYGADVVEQLHHRASMALKGEKYSIEELENFAKELTLTTSELLKQRS